MHSNGSELSIDPKRIVIAGQSAGAGMVAGLTIMNRDRNGPEPAFQILLYPMLDNLHDTPSGRLENHPIWNRQTSLNAWEMYLNGTPGKAASPYAAAARATDLSGLPPAYVAVGTQDLFRDECIDYANRLMAAGVLTELAVFPGIFHGADTLVPHAKICQRMNQSILEAFQNVLAER